MKHAEFNRLVEPQRSDPRGRLPITTLVTWLIEAASDHAESRGFGFSYLRQNNTGWVLARMAVEIYESPKAYEQVRIETWVDDFNRLFSTRNFALFCPPKPPRRGDVSAIERKTENPLVYGLLKEFSTQHRRFSTEAESVLWECLREKGLGERFRRQHIIDDFIVDFVCLPVKLVVELDGEYHDTAAQKEADELRTSILENHGFRIVRFTNHQVLSDTDTVLKRIKELISEPPQPNNEACSSNESPDIPPSGGLGGAPFGYARTQWSMIDLSTRKAHDLTAMSAIADLKDDRPCPIAPPGKIVVTQSREVDTYRVRYSDIDVNRHVNTVKYIEHALNLFSLEFFDHHTLCRMEVQFMAEVRFGDTLSFHLSDGDDPIYAIEIQNQNNEPVSRLKLTFKPIQETT